MCDDSLIQAICANKGRLFFLPEFTPFSSVAYGFSLILSSIALNLTKPHETAVPNVHQMKIDIVVIDSTVSCCCINAV